LDPVVPEFVTVRETETDAPRLFVHKGAERRALTPQSEPYPQLAGVSREVLRYQRADGVGLSGTLYLPANYRKGQKLPTLVWIYPYEFTDQEQAEQLDLRNFRYHQVKGPSPLAAVVAGYAVLMNPTVPIMYEGSSVNDGYLAQLVSSLEAAVGHLVELGVSDPARMAVGGRSYGSFSSANLLIHSELFATAVCMSGAYNRTLTPFGFQHEKRSFWEAGEMYADISPFFHADQVKKPIILIHGGSDENAGTPPMQARRFVHALIGEGATVRYVELPAEGHHYWARENVLLAAAEMLDWLDLTIGTRAGKPVEPATLSDVR
jgi:dipeptidyl aminopeptidase/acylaminoacyl peptidase